MSIYERVSQILHDILGVQVKKEHNLRSDLGVDSTEMVEITVKLEKEFGQIILDIKTAQTVGEIVGLIENKMRAIS